MSYDVSLKNNPVLDLNFTYNLYNMFNEAALSTKEFKDMEERGKLGELAQSGFHRASNWCWSFNNLNGAKCSDVTRILVPMLTDMLGNRKKYEVFNPENGWGDYDGAVRILTKIILACNKYREDTLEVC